jgi:CheY-like chemotaxis protein
MPVQDGLGAAAEIRALAGSKAKVPILALTANTLSDQRATYAAAGMNDCIAKPVNLADLYAKVTYWASAESAAAQTSAA